MKLIIFFVIVLICQPALAANYYVAPPASGGSDSNPGTLVAPYATIQRASTAAVAGDNVYIRAGTYRETVTPTHSGTAGARITYQNYNDEVVTISGADIVSPASWTLDSGSIYQAPLAANFFTSSFNQALQVFVNGEMVTLAKWPNTTTKTNAYPSGIAPAVDISHPAKSVTTSFISKTRDNTTRLTTGIVADTALPPRPAGFYNGAEIYFQPNNNAWSWIFSGVVTNVPANGNQITFTSRSESGKDFGQTVYDPASRYYLFNKKEFLDTPGEWWHDLANSRLHLWTPNSSSPAASVVEVKKRDFAFNLTNRSHITIQGVRLFACSISTDTGSGGSALGHDTSGNIIYPWRGAGYLAPSTGIVIDGIRAQYLNHFTDISGHFFLQWGTCTGIVLSGTGHTIRNSTIEKTAGNGIELLGNGHTVFNNILLDTAYGGTDAAAVNTVSAGTGTDHVISYNTIRRTGRSGITPRSHANSNAAGGQFKARYHHNDIAYFGLQDWDVGGFYTAVGDAQFVRIDHNLVSEGRGFISAGIYLDYTKNYIVHNNVVWNVEWGIKIHGHSGNENNTLVYHNTSSVRNLSSTPYGPFAIGNGSGTNVGTVLRNNILTLVTPPAANGYQAITGGTAFSSAEIAANLAWNGVAGSTTDPRFVNAATTLDAAGVNYMIQTGSAAIDSGSVIPTYTRNGISVPPFQDFVQGGAPDAGAYEFNTIPWIAGASLTQCFPPEFSPGSGSYVSAVTVSLSSLTNGASIRYTTDGSTPSASSGMVYTTPFVISSTSTVKAITTNGILADSAVVTVSYAIVPPASLTLSANPISITRLPGSTTPASLTIGSGGPGSLTWNLAAPLAGNGLNLADSASGGPAFAWQDTSTGGTSILAGADDSTSAAISLGFTFRYLGVDYTQVTVCSNGFISLGSAVNNSAFNNVTLPTNTLPAAAIALFWDDLILDGSASIRWKQIDAQTWGVTFSNVPGFNAPTERITAQAILKFDGSIKLQYRDNSRSPSYTIGYQGTATNGFTVANNIPFLANGNNINRALTLTPPVGWITGVSPASGNVAVGGTTPVSIGIDTSSLTAGLNYTANLTLTSNDPAQPTVVIPVNLTMGGAAPTITSGQSAGLFANTYQSHQLLATGNPTSWSLSSGSLPPGLGLNAITGEISGIATANGTFSPVFIASNSIGSSTAVSVSLTVSTLPPLYAYEGFTQAAATVLNATPASGTGWSGNWTTDIGSNASVQASGLGYTTGGLTLLTSGRSLLRPSFGRSKLSLDSAAFPGLVTNGAIGGINAVGKSLYVSFLVKGADPALDTLLQLDDSAGNAIVGLRNQQVSDWRFQRQAGFQGATTVAVSPATTYLAVIRIDFVAGTGNDVIRLYLNPASLTSEPATALVTFNTIDVDALKALQLFTNQTGDRVFDELRFGASYATVLPLAPPALATPVIAASQMASGTVNAAFSYQIAASNTPASYALSSGTLPPGVTLNTATGLLSGTLTTAGSYTPSFTATNSGGTSPAVAVTLTIIAAPTGVETFRSANGLAADGSQDLLTPAGDGVANLLKFAFNMIGSGAGQGNTLETPNASILTPTGSAGLPYGGMDGTGKLQITFVRRTAASNSGISYQVEFSDALENWAVNPSATESFNAIDSSLERVTITDSLAAPNTRFARLRVVSP